MEEYPDFVQTCGLGSVTGIGGANCRHSYWPFIEGVSQRTYTDEELEEIDPPPFSFEGKTYTQYEATQKQRQIEGAIRRLKRERAAYRAAGLKEEETAVSARIRRLDEEYRAFSKAAGLPQQRERMNVAYTYDARATAKAEVAKVRHESEAEAVKSKHEAEASIREAIRQGDYPLNINPEKQARHMAGTATPGRSVITISQEELQEIINMQAGHGKIHLDKNGNWDKKELINAKREIGYTINRDFDIIKTTKAKIHYSKTGVHVVPYSGR